MGKQRRGGRERRGERGVGGNKSGEEKWGGQRGENAEGRRQ